MNIETREYRPGDEFGINRLYRLITKLERNLDEVQWEWLDTWDGRGSIWVMLDHDRDAGDELIGHHGLIPVPMILDGRAVLCGKTENSMMHPDYRGTGLYFPFEQWCFAQAGKRFVMFFTTTGQGKPGSIRKKLGYRLLDGWTTMTRLVDPSGYIRRLRQGIARRLGDLPVLTTGLSLAAYAACRTWFPRRRKAQRTGGPPITIYGEGEGFPTRMQTLWDHNRDRYGTSVDRTAGYLEWRLERNPHRKHHYIACGTGDDLCGYAVVSSGTDDTLEVVDILADSRRPEVLDLLFEAVDTFATDTSHVFVRCSTLKNNRLLVDALRRNGFIRGSPGAPWKTADAGEFYAWTPDDTDPANWYVTPLVMEGR